MSPHQNTTIINKSLGPYYTNLIQEHSENSLFCIILYVTDNIKRVEIISK